MYCIQKVTKRNLQKESYKNIFQRSFYLVFKTFSYANDCLLITLHPKGNSFRQDKKCLVIVSYHRC